MAVLRVCSSKAAVGGARSRARVVVTCQKGENRLVEKVQVAAASFAAAALLTVSPANAGVVLEQPQLKKLFIDTTPAAPAKPVSKEIPTLKTKNAATSAPAPKAEEKKAEPKKAEAEGAEGADLDIRAVALPGALAFVVGAYFALTKLDSGFADFVYNTAVRDSNSYAGFEPALKTGNGTVIGTKKVKATKKK